MKNLTERGEEVAHFFLGFFSRGDGLGDFGTNEFAVPLPQAMDRHRYGLNGHSQAIGGPIVFTNGGFAREKHLELRELSGFSGLATFFAQFIERLFEYGQRPAPLEDFSWRSVGNRLAQIASLGSVIVQGNEGVFSSSFRGARSSPFVGQKMLERF